MQTDQLSENLTKDVSDPEAGLTAGEILRRERLRIGLTEKEVGNSLHITAHYVKAMESDSYEKLPNAVFAKGYIKHYAILLELDTDDLLERYQELAIRKSELNQEVSTSQDRWRKDKNKLWVVLSVTVFICGFTGLWAYNYFAATVDNVPAPDASIINSASAFLPNIGFNATPNTLAEEVGGTNTADLPKEAIRPLGDKLPTGVEAAERFIEIVAAGDDVLRISFSGQSWIEINDVNANQIHRDIRLAGDVLEIRGRSPFNILLGDATFARLTFNGAEINVSDNIRIDNSARLTVGL